MPDDLDLALRVRADVAQAQQQLSALRASIQKSTEDVARANGRQASAAETAARATRTLTQTQQQAAQEGTEAARAAVEKARADSAAAAGALRAARAETQAAQAKARAARTAQQLAQSLDTQTAAQTRANTATAQGVQRTRQLGPAIQNTAFQVGDFAVQVASGTSGLRAFTQQVPQLLGGFGVIGAVLGALVAVGAALVPVFLNLGDAAQDSADATDRLAEAADRLRALERARLDVDALAEAYGRASAQARALNAAQDALANRLAARALAEEIAGFDDILGAANKLDFSRANSGLFDLARRLRDIISDLKPEELVTFLSDASGELRAAVETLVENADLTVLQSSFANNKERLIQELTSLAKLSDEVFEARATGTGAAPEIAENLGLTEEAARRLIVAYGELRDAEGFTAQATALGTLREELVEVRAETADQSEQQRKEVDGFIARILEAEQSTLQLVAASGDVAPGLDNATAAAGRLADELGRAGQSLATLQARAESRIRRAQIRIDFADNPEERTRRLRIEAQDEAEREALVPRLPALRAVGLSTTEINLVTRELREKAGAAFDAQQAAQALEDQLRDLGRTGSGAGRAASREIERLAEAQRKAAQEARALETATQDALRAYSADALEARDEVANAWVDGFRGLEDALVGFVTTGKLNFSDLVNSILADLARIAIRRNITGPIANALGNALGGGGGGGGVFGVFGGGGGAAASSAVTLPTFRPFHSGGVPTGPDTPGLAPGEVPALLMRGEAVITSAQSRALLGIDRAAQDRDRAMTILRAAARYHTGGVAGLPGGNTIPETAGGGVTGSAPPMNVSVEINNAGTPQRVENAGARVDVRGFVVSLFLDDLAAGGPMARGIQNIVPGTRL